MLRISDNRIFLTRGDSAYITLNITDNSGNRYELLEGDVVRVQVRTSPNNGDLLFNGKIEFDENGQIIWHILPSDTFHKPIATYYYDAQLLTANGDVFTFIPASKFKLLDEVTCNE